MTTFHKQLKKSWKDVLIIYTARWCTYSTRLEEILHRMIRAGEFDDFEDEIQFVKIDVVLTQAEDYKALQTVPAIKYVSARYKDFPNWYGGRHDSADEIVQFVHSYHSMRHVEIPGEGPSPYSVNARPKHTDDEGGLLEREADNVVF
jgi:glutaredoxin